MKILCVDDAESVRAVLTRMLELKGHAVTTAISAPEAVALTGNILFDWIVVDHLMAATTGLELVRHLRATNYAGKIIVFSGALPAEARKAYEALKVDAIALKPSGFAEILKLIPDA